MRLFFLLSLTIFAFAQHSQPPSPTPSKATNANQKQPKPEQQQTRPDEQFGRDLTTAINQLTAEIAAQNQQQSATPNKNEAPTNGWTVLNTILTTVFTGILAVLAILQWRALHRQADIYDRQAGIADKQADIAAEQLELTKTAESRRDFEKTIEGFEKTREQKLADDRYSQQLSLAQEGAVTAKQSADAATLNSNTVIRSERAWIFADLLPTLGSARFIGDGETNIYARINCRNVGRSPAWIIEIRARFTFVQAGTLPLEPILEDAEQVWAGTHPIGPNEEAFSTGDYTFTAQGIQGIDSVTGEWAVVYGVAKYRDIYQTIRQTTFGYRLMPGTDVRFTRLINYPKYNEGS